MLRGEFNLLAVQSPEELIGKLIRLNLPDEAAVVAAKDLWTIRESLLTTTEKGGLV